MSVINHQYREKAYSGMCFQRSECSWLTAVGPMKRQNKVAGVQIKQTIHLMVAGKESWKGWRGMGGVLSILLGVSP